MNRQTTAPLRDIDQALAEFLHRQYPEANHTQCQLAALVSQQLAHGHTCLPVTESATQQQVADVCGQTLSSLLEGNPLVSADGKAPLVYDGGYLYLRRYWVQETCLAGHVHARLAPPSPDRYISTHELKAMLDSLFTSEDTLDWQKMACALVGRAGIGIITGGPGTGKTTTVVKLLAVWQQWAHAQGNPWHIQLAAPTGKAAHRLEASISGAINQLPVTESLKQTLPAKVQTLHRLLGSKPDSRHFRHHRDNPLLADMVVVDEASMVDMDMMVALLEALPLHSRLILVGDKDQLESVEAGAVMADLCVQADQVAYTEATCHFIREATGMKVGVATTPGCALAQQTVKLQKNWRSKDAVGINELAQAVNQQDCAGAQAAFEQYPDQLTRPGVTGQWIWQRLIDSPQGLGNLLDTMHKTRPDDSTDTGQINQWAQHLLDRLASQQLLTPLRRGPDGLEELNLRIIDRLYQKKWIRDKVTFAGKPLLVTTNLHDLGLMNGDMGLLLDHPVLGLRVAFAEGTTVRWIIPEQLETRSQTGFALSVHQSQGSEFNRVLLYLPDVDPGGQAARLLTKELVYTAITRARQQFTLLEGREGLFEQAVVTPTQRYSGLARRLRDER